MIVKMYKETYSLGSSVISTCNPVYNYRLFRIWGPAKRVGKYRKNTTERSVITDEQIIGYVPLGFV